MLTVTRNNTKSKARYKDRGSRCFHEYSKAKNKKNEAKK